MKLLIASWNTQVALLLVLFVGFCIGSLSGKSCPTTSDGECNGRGECAGSNCICNIGFGGLDCSDALYRAHHHANFDTASSLTLIPFLLGTSSGDSITIELDSVMKISEYPSSTSRLFHVSQSGTNDIFELSISSEGKLVILSTCGSTVTSGIESELSIPMNTWVHINLKVSGSHQASGCPTNGQAKLLVGQELYIDQQVHLPVSMVRNMGIIGEFVGSVDYIRVLQYDVGSVMEGTCLENEQDYELFNCDFADFDSNICGTLDSSQLELSTNSLLDRFRYGMYVWTHGIQLLNNEVGWFFQLYDKDERASIISVARQRGIDLLLVNNVCPSSDCACSTVEWKYNDTNDLLKQAHQYGIQVYALYTEEYFIDDIFSYTEAAQSNQWDLFDGIALNFESFNYSKNPEDFFVQVQDTKSMTDILGIPLHVSVSFAWTVNATWNGITKPFQDHLLGILTAGDSLDIQVAWPDHCIYEDRATTYIKAASQKNVSSWITMETKKAFSSIGWYNQGEDVMWEDIRDSFGNTLPPTGFILHHYKDAINSGSPGWDLVGLPYCPTHTDSCGACGGTGAQCNWTSLWMSQCGDGLCQPELGETCTNCPQDCSQNDANCFEIQVPSVCMTKTSVKEGKKKTALSLDVMIIIGASIGGLVCTIIAIILGLVIHKKIKRKLHKPKAPPPVKPLIKTKNIDKLEQESNERARRMTMSLGAPPDISQLALSNISIPSTPNNDLPPVPFNRPRSATISSMEFRRPETPPTLQSSTSPLMSRKGGLVGQKVPNDIEGSPTRPRKLPPLKSNSSFDDFPSRPTVNSLIKDDKRGQSLSKSGERMAQSGELNRSSLISRSGEIENRSSSLISRSGEIEMSQMVSGTELKIGERQRRPTISISVDFSQPMMPIKESKDLF